MRATALLLAAGGWAFATVATAASEAAPNESAAPVVYRCKQANGGVLYADFPCGRGVIVDIKPDSADPRAIERLQRATEEFDRSAAQRRYAEQVAAIRGEASYDQRRAVEPPQDSADYDTYAGYGIGYGSYVPAAIPRKKHFHLRPHPEPHRVVAEKRQVPGTIRRPAPG